MNRFPLVALVSAAVSGACVMAACSSFPTFGTPEDASAADVLVDFDGGIDAETDVRDGGAGDAAEVPVLADCTPPVPPLDGGTFLKKVVVGTGTAASCTEASLRAALTSVDVPGGGAISFNCGSAPATIVLSQVLSVSTTASILVDGGSKVTLSGNGATGIFERIRNGYRGSSQVLSLQNLAFIRGKVSGTSRGAALNFRDGILRIHNCTFDDNEASLASGTVSGGAIFVDGALQVQISNSTFRNNRAASGGAIGSIQSDLLVYNSTFDGNAALGTGNVGNSPTNLGGVGGAVYAVGNLAAQVTLCAVTAVENRALDTAGGMLVADSQKLTIDRSVFLRNRTEKNAAGTSSGGSCGAFILQSSALVVRGSTFAGNSSFGTGVGLVGASAGGVPYLFENCTFDGNVGNFAGLGLSTDGTFRNCTFSRNHATAWAAALNGARSGTSLLNSVFADNLADVAGATRPVTCAGGDGFGSAGVSGVDGGASNVQTNGGPNDIACANGIAFVPAAKLGPLTAGALPVVIPAADSPARTAPTTRCPATDARGYRRPAQGCTAGAVQ
jgi:hypothetical protein